MVQQQTTAPVNARPKIIDTVVTIQVFELDRNNPSQIVPSSMKKIVGILEAYQIYPGAFAFKFKGLDREQYQYSTHLVEIYLS
jgi:hypothetical protein